MNATVTRAMVRRPDEDLGYAVDLCLVCTGSAGWHAGWYGFVERKTGGREGEDGRCVCRANAGIGSRRAAGFADHLRLDCSSCAAVLFCCRCAVLCPVAMSKGFCSLSR